MRRTMVTGLVAIGLAGTVAACTADTPEPAYSAGASPTGAGDPTPRPDRVRPNCDTIGQRLPAGLISDMTVQDGSQPESNDTWYCYLTGKLAADGRSAIDVQITIRTADTADRTLSDDALDQRLRTYAGGMFGGFCDNPTQVTGVTTLLLSCSNDRYTPPALTLAYATVAKQAAVGASATVRPAGTVDQIRVPTDQATRAVLDTAVAQITP